LEKPKKSFNSRSCTGCMVERCVSCIKETCILSEKICRLCSEDKTDDEEFEDLMFELEECQSEKLSKKHNNNNFGSDAIGNDTFEYNNEEYDFYP